MPKFIFHSTSFYNFGTFIQGITATIWFNIIFQKNTEKPSHFSNKTSDKYLKI